VLKKWSKAARFGTKSGQKWLKSAHNSSVFGHFPTVQQSPEYVFAPINTDFPPKNSTKFPFFAFSIHDNLLLLYTHPVLPAPLLAQHTHVRCAHIWVLFVYELLLKNCFLIEPASEHVILWRSEWVLPGVFGQKT
jgi:hypothetical protein